MNSTHLVFDYRQHRTMIGTIAILLPLIVIAIADSLIPSISASYYVEAARSIFVGSLFIVGSFLFAYNGHSGIKESIPSKVAGLCAILIAYFPTAPAPLKDQLADAQVQCQQACQNADAIHLYASVGLFAILFYFCLLFAKRAKVKGNKGSRRREKLYYACAAAMVIAGSGMAFGFFTTFVTEWIFLWAFGIAWFVSGKYIPGLKDTA